MPHNTRPKKFHWDAHRSVEENAAEKLPQLARHFLAEGEQAASVKAPLDQVHRFRLLTKRFRYALELFRPYYGPGLASKIEALRILQQILGAVSDCSTTQALLQNRDDLSGVSRARLLRHLNGMTDSRVNEFRAHWRQEFASPARQRSWTGYLTRFAGARRK